MGLLKAGDTGGSWGNTRAGNPKVGIQEGVWHRWGKGARGLEPANIAGNYTKGMTK